MNPNFPTATLLGSEFRKLVNPPPTHRSAGGKGGALTVPGADVGLGAELVRKLSETISGKSKGDAGMGGP